jgi:hypothetical protein
MAVLAVIVRKRFVIKVDDTGVTAIMWGPTLSIPWSDIERMEGHRLSARLLRRSNGKRVFVSMLDPAWTDRPVTRAIRSHLAS